MSDDRYGNNDPKRDYYGRPQSGDYGSDYGSGRSDTYSSARSYQAAGELGGDRNRQGGRGGDDRNGQGNRMQGRDYYGGQGSYDQDRQRTSGGGGEYHGSYASDGRRFEDVGRYRDADDDNRRGGYGYQGRDGDRGQGRNQDRGQDRGRDYGRQPQGYQYEERGFFQRAGDEVRSWFGDDDAERRRERDARMDEQHYGQADNHRDNDYHSWRRGQMDALDRDYHEYRQENRQKFESEFGAWRTARQGQRDSLSKVTEHQEVVGSDGEHVGTVDKVRGDRIILTKNDADAGGRHHSIPSRWIQTVDTKVTLGKTAQEAKDHWRDEERNQAIGGDDQRQGTNTSQDRQSQSGLSQGGSSQEGQAGSVDLNRSFPGTY